MLKLYKKLFYYIYRNELFFDSDELNNAYVKYFVISFLVFFWIIILLCIFQIYFEKLFISAKWFMAPLGLIFIFNYFFFMFKKRYKKYIREVENEIGVIEKHDIRIVMIFFLFIVSFFSSILIAGLTGEMF